MTVRDVTLRDGLQNLPVVIETREKVRLYQMLLAAGLEELQVTSFVSPKRVPALADAEALWRALTPTPGRKDALIANYRGYERARAAGVGRMEMVFAVSESYQRQNSGRGREEAFLEISRMAREASNDGVRLAVAVSNAWHCSYEGDTSWEALAEWIERLASLELAEVVIADTTGSAEPAAVSERVGKVKGLLANTYLRVHLHVLESRGDDVDKARAAITAGADALDGGLLRLGGSPFAGQVGGNLSLRPLAEAGVVPLDPGRLAEAEVLLSSLLGN